MERVILYLVPGTAALVVFLVWRWLAGPSLHWVESVIGLGMAAAVYLWLFLTIRQRLGR
ncbi:MAG: hypothetical protein ACFBRM_03810 [Pikeienuella sp.]